MDKEVATQNQEGQKSLEVEKTEHKKNMVQMRVRISTREERGKNMLGMLKKENTWEMNGVEEFPGHDKALEPKGNCHLRSRECFPSFSKVISCRLCAPKNVCVSAMRVAASGVGIRVPREKKRYFLFGACCV